MIFYFSIAIINIATNENLDYFEVVFNDLILKSLNKAFDWLLL